MCKLPPNSRQHFDPRGQEHKSRASKSSKHQITKQDKGRATSKASSKTRGGRTKWLILFPQNRHFSDLKFFIFSPPCLFDLGTCTSMYSIVSYCILCRHFALIIIKNYHVIDSISLIGQIECNQFAKNGRELYAVKLHPQCHHAGSPMWSWNDLSIVHFPQWFPQFSTELIVQIVTDVFPKPM